MKVIERKRFGARGQGALLKYEGVSIWHSEIWVRGKPHVWSTSQADEKKARRFHRQKLDEVAADRQGLRKLLSPAIERVKVGELLDAFEADRRLHGLKSINTFACHLKPIREHFDDWRASEVTAEAVDQYIEKRLALGKANATINREVQELGQSLRLAMQRGRVTAVPRLTKLSEKGNARSGFFEAQEISKIENALPATYRDFFLFATATGMRKGEIASLRWSDVDREGQVIKLPAQSAKTGKGRTIAIAGDLVSLMEHRWQARLLDGGGDVRVSDWVFHRDGRPIGDIRKAWADACIKAGLYHVVKDATGRERKVPDKLFHDTRRTAVRNMVRAGIPQSIVMKVSGHRTPSVFLRYDIVDERDTRAAMERVSRYQEGALERERGIRDGD